MERAYISSTVEDLAEYRSATADALRNCGCDVEWMEKYAARDERPKAACEADVRKCDIYIGIFAWRYGFIPAEDNPEKKSITELEYLAAGEKKRFIFLLKDNVPWIPTLVDSAENMRKFRERMRKETWVCEFGSPYELKSQVMQTVLQFRSPKKVSTLSEMQNINDAKEFGPSYLPNIQAQISQLASGFVALRLGPTPWWDTRLHLAAALTSDFTEIRQFILLDGERRYLTMSSPVEIRRALAKSSFALENLYSAARAEARNRNWGNEIDNIIACYPGAVGTVFPGQTEEQVKRVITPTLLNGLGIRPQGEVINLVGSERWSQAEVLRRQSPYIVVRRDGEVEGVIDRMELASQLASQLVGL
jgi:Domain of unknown function (DUF4062)